MNKRDKIAEIGKDFKRKICEFAQFWNAFCDFYVFQVLLSIVAS